MAREVPTPPCQWPADGHTPEPLTWFEQEMCRRVAGWGASHPEGNGPTLDVCFHHAALAQAHRWEVVDQLGPVYPGTMADHGLTGYEWTPQAGEPDYAGAWDPECRPAPGCGVIPPEPYEPSGQLADALAAVFRPDVPDLLPPRFRVRRGGVVYPSPPPPPDPGPLWPAGDQPRGLVAPVIAYGVLGVAVGLALAGEALDAWAKRRRRRQLLRALLDAGVTE